MPLAVTAGDLRAGQGYVRCGRCANVFNALLALSEEPGNPAHAFVPPPEPVSEPPPPPPPPAATPTALSAMAMTTAPPPGTDFDLPDEPTLPDVAEAAARMSAAPHLGDAAPAQHTAQAEPAALAEQDMPPEEAEPDEVISIEAASDSSDLREFRGTGTYETIVLEGDAITQTEEVITEEEPPPLRPVDNELATLRSQLADALPPDVDDRNRRVKEDEGEFIDTTAEDQVIAALAPASEAAASRRRRPEPEFAPARWPWVAASLALAVVLAAQAVHHWRNELAARPFWNGPLTAVYRELGVELAPEWDLSRYDVRQLGAEGDASGKAINVRVSVANRSERDQPVPWLRLTLLDRFGKRVAARDLPPADYLPKANRDLRFLSPDQRIDSEVAVVEPGPNAASFEVDVCLPGAGGQVRCANDRGALTAAR